MNGNFLIWNKIENCTRWWTKIFYSKLESSNPNFVGAIKLRVPSLLEKSSNLSRYESNIHLKPPFVPRHLRKMDFKRLKSRKSNFQLLNHDSLEIHPLVASSLSRKHSKAPRRDNKVTTSGRARVENKLSSKMGQLIISHPSKPSNSSEKQLASALNTDWMLNALRYSNPNHRSENVRREGIKAKYIFHSIYRNSFLFNRFYHRFFRRYRRLSHRVITLVNKWFIPLAAGNCFVGCLFTRWRMFVCWRQGWRRWWGEVVGHGCWRWRR